MKWRWCDAVDDDDDDNDEPDEQVDGDDEGINLSLENAIKLIGNFSSPPHPAPFCPPYAVW